jgi:hypothetical protein
MGTSLHLMPKPSATDKPPGDSRPADKLVPATNGGRKPAASEGYEPFARFRRRLERFRGDADAQDHSNSLDEEAELRLQVMLLREENARLKEARHRPPDVGTLIDRLRLIAEQKGESETLDEAWTLLSECLVIREELVQACTEIGAAIGVVHERLRNLAVKIDGLSPEDAAQNDVAIARASSSS